MVDYSGQNLNGGALGTIRSHCHCVGVYVGAEVDRHRGSYVERQEWPVVTVVKSESESLGESIQVEEYRRLYPSLISEETNRQAFVRTTRPKTVPTLTSDSCMERVQHSAGAV